MNYLAHSFLSDNKPGLIVGNFIADHLHGNHFEDYSPEIIEGIKLHRKIDSFTDSHPKFLESKRFFYDGFEKYSGILIDIFFDHLLARSFENYSATPLKLYSENIYQVYKNHRDMLPKSSSNFLSYVLENNVYEAYGTEKGIETVLFHLSHRIKHGVWLNESLKLFKNNEEKLDENFRIFFTDIRNEFLPQSLK